LKQVYTVMHNQKNIKSRLFVKTALVLLRVLYMEGGTTVYL